MKIESFNVSAFQKGDIVCQVERTAFRQPHYNENLGIEIDTIIYTDGSYLGKPLRFIGVANNHIIFQHVREDYPWNCGDLLELHIDQWDGVWAKWVDPKSLL